MSKTVDKATEASFISYLYRLADRDDRAALAALRRGLGREPGSAAEMHPYVAPFLPDDLWSWHNQCHYILASLFALNPNYTDHGNLGHTFGQIRNQRNSESIEKRFVALLKCHRDDLFDHLRHAVSLAKSNNVAINWQQLFLDIKYWDDEQAWAQRYWAKAFWGESTSPEEERSGTEEKGA